MLEWLPGVDHVVIAGADHSLAVTHCRQVADAIASFLHTHPLDRDIT